MATYPVTARTMTQQPPSSSNLRFPAWQREYEATIHEAEPKKLLQYVHAAETAIFNRLQELARNSDNPESKAEHQAIADALGVLRILKRDKLDFPDWESH